MTRVGITTVTAHCPTCARPTTHIQLQDGTFTCKTCLGGAIVNGVHCGRVVRS